MDDREVWVTRTLLELTDTLVSDFDLVELLATLVTRCGELLDAAEVGILLRGPHGDLNAMSSTSERMHGLQLLEIQNTEGPCLECVRTGRPVPPVPLNDDAARRWPTFTTAARRAGYRQVLALPMRLRDQVIGALNVFTDHDRSMSEADLRVAQALADSATIGILQDRAVQDSEELVRQLQGALDSRVVIEQAKGILSEAQGVSIDDAFAALRTHARANNLRLVDLARAVSTREVATDDLRQPPGAGIRGDPRG